MMENYFLVNVVHNDFRNPEAIFAPFYRAAEAIKAKGQANGVPNGIPNGHTQPNGIPNGYAQLNGNVRA